MNIKELKRQIENNDVADELIVFRYEDNDFIPTQYIKAISDNKKIGIEYIHDVTEFAGDNDFFGLQNDKLRVLRTDILDDTISIRDIKNIIVLCNKCADSYSDYVVDIPKLEQWQIIDYLYSMLPEVEQNSLYRLAMDCHYDIYRIENEIEKLTIFDSGYRNSMFNEFISDNVLSDLSQYNIFNFTNAVVKKDINKLSEIYRDIDNIDIEPFGLLTTLINNFRDIITIQLANNPTPESVGMPSNKFWAISHSCGVYNKEQLVKIFGFLTNLDEKVKTGQLSIDILIDYITEKVLTI